MKITITFFSIILSTSLFAQYSTDFEVSDRSVLQADGWTFLGYSIRTLSARSGTEVGRSSPNAVSTLVTPTLVFTGSEEVSIWFRSTNTAGAATITISVDGGTSTATHTGFSNGTWQELRLTVTDVGNFEIRIQTNTTAHGSVRALLDDFYTDADLYIAPLPVNFLEYEADFLEQEQAVHINWTTISETNNSHFEILKSTDAISFYPIGKIQGNGNSSSFKFYEFIDYQLNSAIIYYKIKQVDIDGVYEMTPVFYARTNTSTKTSIRVFSSTGDLLFEGKKEDFFEIAPSHQLFIIQEFGKSYKVIKQ